LAKDHDILVTVEDNAVMGGAGSAVNEVLAAKQVLIPTLNLGLPDIFMEQSSREELLADASLSSGGIIQAIKDFIETQAPVIGLDKHITVA
ncbi:MAG: hypothetical protein OEY89_12135, partial [Gammaproteobacteria bacterium]|nr:hypothetical protein [Gammaproteobacteria bacterium]